MADHRLNNKKLPGGHMVRCRHQQKEGRMRRYCETDRRAFLQALAGLAAEVVVGMPSMTRAQPMAQFTRRDIRKLDPDSPEIKAVRAGIAVMKARPNTDKTSWSFQANMHGTTLSGNNTIWRKCQHGHWWFFPW